MSRPLRSTTTPASSGFTATTGRSASERRDRYSMPPVSAVGTLPLAARQTDPQARTAAFVARLLTFRARAAAQDHAAFTPGTAWPTITGSRQAHPEGEIKPPGFDAIYSVSTPQQRTPGLFGRTLLERLPGPHLTRSEPRRFPGRSPRQSSANAAPGRFDAYPRRADAEGPTILHLSHSTAYMRGLLHSSSFSVRDARSRSDSATTRAWG
jgi:hypothetical protein